jgi:hypothetical protein
LKNYLQKKDDLKKEELFADCCAYIFQLAHMVAVVHLNDRPINRLYWEK